MPGMIGQQNLTEAPDNPAAKPAEAPLPTDSKLGAALFFIVLMVLVLLILGELLVGGPPQSAT